MGFIHLSQSLVVAGGYDRKCSGTKQVYQINENHSWLTLPSMKYSRYGFPLVEFNDGETIVAICGCDNDNHLNNC